MPISPIGLVAGLVIAKSKNLPGPKVAEDALLAGFVRPPIVGIVLASALAQNQASAGGSGGAAPSPPVVTAVAATSDEVILTWTATLGANSYNVIRTNTETGVAETPGQNVPVTAFDDQNLDPDTIYSYVVNAVDANNTLIASSAAVLATTPE